MMGCGHNLIDIYIFELSYFRDYYVKAYMEFCEDIASTCLPYAKKIKMLKAQHKDENDYCIWQENDFQEFANYIDLQYNCLSGFLQNLVSFWENQLNDYYLMIECKDFAELKTELERYINLNLDKEHNLEIYEIRQVDNYLKHGQFGNAEKNLIDINSRFYRNDKIKGEIRGNFFRNKQLEIQVDDIEYFANKFIDFWKEVASKL